MVELVKTAADMVEHAVENHLHPPRMRLIQQLPQRRISTQERIHLVVVVRVIAVVGSRLEDGIEIERGDPQFR